MSSKDVSPLMGASTAVVVAFVEELHWVIVRPTSGASNSSHGQRLKTKLDKENASVRYC
jgi:hypothetical protein